jgi:DNA-binding NtrC family response regulator
LKSKNRIFKKNTPLSILAVFYSKMGKTPDIEPALMRYLETREYKGNICKLRQLVSRILVRHIGDVPITASDIPEADLPKISLAQGPSVCPPSETVFTPL